MFDDIDLYCLRNSFIKIEVRRKTNMANSSCRCDFLQLFFIQIVYAVQVSGLFLSAWCKVPPQQSFLNLHLTDELPRPSGAADTAALAAVVVITAAAAVAASLILLLGVS